MKCSFCGANNASKSEVCSSCGKPLLTRESNLSKKKGKEKLILLLSVIALAIILVVLVVLILNPSPKKIFVNSVNKFYGVLLEDIESDQDSASINIELTPSISGTGSSELEEIVNKFKISASGAISTKDQTLIYNYKLDYDEKSIFDFDAQYDDGLYLFLNGIYDKPLIIDDSDFSSLFEYDGASEDEKTVISSMKNAFNKSLKSDYFTSSKKEVTYSGKSVNAKVTTLILNEENLTKIYDDMMSYLADDEDFINAYANAFNVSNDKVISMLGEDASLDFTSDVEISIYTTGVTNDFIKVAFTSNETTIEFQNKDQDGNYLLSIKNDEVSIGFNIKCEISYDEDVNLNDTTGAVNYDDVSDELSSSLGKILQSEGYLQFDDDFRSFTGMGIDEYILYLMGFNDTYDEYEYDYDTYYDSYYDYDTDYDYSTLFY